MVSLTSTKELKSIIGNTNLIVSGNTNYGTGMQNEDDYDNVMMMHYMLKTSISFEKLQVSYI